MVKHGMTKGSLHVELGFFEVHPAMQYHAIEDNVLVENGITAGNSRSQDHTGPLDEVADTSLLSQLRKVDPFPG